MAAATVEATIRRLVMAFTRGAIAGVPVVAERSLRRTQNDGREGPVSKGAAEKTIRDLSRRLAKEEQAHQDTRRLLQSEISRVWRLVPSYYINLMGVYPPLRKLLHVLAEAADLQDPSRGAPIEDTMRTLFVHVGANASTSHTEAAVSSHVSARRHASTIRDELDNLAGHFTKLLDDKARNLARLISSEEWEYQPPDKPVCWRKDCSHRGRQQPYSAWHIGCGGCGRVFEMERTGT